MSIALSKILKLFRKYSPPIKKEDETKTLFRSKSQISTQLKDQIVQKLILKEKLHFLNRKKELDIIESSKKSLEEVYNKHFIQETKQKQAQTEKLKQEMLEFNKRMIVNKRIKDRVSISLTQVEDLNKRHYEQEEITRIQEEQEYKQKSLNKKKVIARKAINEGLEKQINEKKKIEIKGADQNKNETKSNNMVSQKLKKAGLQKTFGNRARSASDI